MSSRSLSPREEEIVGLCVEGLTNDAIAIRLGLSIGTVNTYWLRIKLKVGGTGRTDTVAKIISEKAEAALRESSADRVKLTDFLIASEHHALELRAAVALLNLAMGQIKSTAWTTDTSLSIHVIANGEYPSTHCGVKWEVGKSVYDIFKTENPLHPGVAAHLSALTGKPSEVRLDGEFANMHLRVGPVHDDQDNVLGCVSVLSTIGN